MITLHHVPFVSIHTYIFLSEISQQRITTTTTTTPITITASLALIHFISLQRLSCLLFCQPVVILLVTSLLNILSDIV
uniref:Uncharacterized protein n=1 Tax=Onchocerca volvulus TaxID=6282 RepID=A0A8R1XP79_ONCVO